MHKVAALYVHRNSEYKKNPYIDCYDQERDARNYTGHLPVIAHPPCATWGRLAQFSTQNTHELGYNAIQQVERCGGVIEHPAGTKLFNYITPGKGFILSINQSWFGHVCQKRTWLYIVGISPGNIPPYPITLDRPLTNIQKISKNKRELTPPVFAQWLYDLAVLTTGTHRIPEAVFASGGWGPGA